MKLSTEYRAFSPNDDGIQDNIKIFIRTQPESDLPLASYSVKITGPRGVTRTILSDNRKVRSERSAGNLYLPGTYSIRDLTAPDFILWDGYDDSGRKVPDGSYKISFSARTKSSFYITDQISVDVQTREPSVRLRVISPILRVPIDSEGNRLNPSNEIRISQSASGGNGFRFIGKILDRSGNIVEFREYSGSLTSTVTWNGKSRDGSLVDDGNYSYSLTVQDQAGNTAREEIHNIVVSSNNRSAYLGPSNRVYSNRSDELSKRKITFELTGSVSASDFAILDSSGNIIYKKPLYGSVPRRIEYNGNGIQSDGLHSAVLLSGNRAVSIPGTFVVDRNPPDLSLSSSENIFTPDRDGSKDTTEIRFSYSDFSDIDQYRVSFEIMSPEKEGKAFPVRSFSGSTLPKTFVWDGTGFDGVELESLETVSVIFSVRDSAGNIATAEPLIIKTGVLFRPVKPGSQDLVARLPERNYFNESEGKITNEGEEMIDEVLDTLNRYRRYFVYVESHSRVEGREEDNLRRTEAIAYHFFEEFSDSYWPLNRMSYAGLGETELLFEESTPFANYRNDRIEIKLVYDDKFQK